MDTIYRRCAGLDVHKKTVEACVRRMEDDDVVEETRHYETMTRDLLSLADWLEQQGVTHVAMESTGSYWKPIFNLLEDRFEVILVNAKHVRQVPGRKTDVKDCQWLAKLMQHGLLSSSFIPDTPQRDLRDLTRYRTQLLHERTREVNRIQKVLEDANLKLASVVTDIMGVSGSEILRRLVEGETDPATLAQLARGRLRNKLPELELALEGKLREHHRFMLRMHLRKLEELETQLVNLEARIDAMMLPFTEEVALLVQIPGVEKKVAEVIIAEAGSDMEQFPSDCQLCSWAGVAPGNNESAGKRRSGRTTEGNHWLKSALVQSGMAAGHTKDTYLGSMFRRLAARRGAKRAAVAVAHAILMSAYHMLRNKVDYKELGPDHFHKKHSKRQANKHVKGLQALGYEVIITPLKAA